MNVILLLVLGGLMMSTRSFTASGAPASESTSLALGYVLITAFFSGTIFNHFRLPKLTGYIAAGIVVGPALLGLVSREMVENLKVVNGMAVAMIALTAGTELELRSMKPSLRAIRWITLVGVVGTTCLLAGAVWFCRDLLPFMVQMSRSEAIATAVVLGVVMVAQSPAVVVALKDELRADGPVSRTVLGVVVLADLLVIFLFAIASTIAKAVFRGFADTGHTLSNLAWEIVGSLVVGGLIGILLSVYLRKVKGGGSLFLLAVTFVVAEVGQRLHFDPLLVALSAGVLVRNATSVGDELHREIQLCALPVYILFFAVTGANLHLNVLAIVWLPACLFVVVRGLGLFFGSRLGARIAQAPKEVQRYAGYGLLPQAGLALALSMLFAKTFPEFGAAASALTLGVVALNELLAPAAYRLGLIRSGEVGQMEPEPPTPGVSPDDLGPLLPPRGPPYEVDATRRQPLDG